MPRIKRYKRVRKALEFYHLGFNFRPPYKVISTSLFPRTRLITPRLLLPR